MSVPGTVGPPSREQQISAAFLELADILVPGFDSASFLRRLTWHCVNLLQIDEAGVMVADSDDRLRLLTASSERVRLVLLSELGGGDGPCLAAYRSGETVVMENLPGTDSRWTAFAARAGNDGLRSVHAIPLRSRGRTVGVMSLFATVAGPLPAVDQHLARALADAATIGLRQHQLIETHRAAAERADDAGAAHAQIEQATAVLNERLGIDVVAGSVSATREEPPGRPEDSPSRYAQRAAQSAHAALLDGERSAQAASRAREAARAAEERLVHRRHPNEHADHRDPSEA
jgi:GAF domain-containing protein